MGRPRRRRDRDRRPPGRPTRPTAWRCRSGSPSSGAARHALDVTTRALGASALCHQPEHAARVADLTVYLSQLHPFRSAVALGRAMVVEPGPPVTTLATATPTWVDGPPAVRDRVVVLAPHPDDEVLGTGALLRWLQGEGVPTTVVAVTDGEASHARSNRIAAATLRGARAEERTAALAALGRGAGARPPRPPRRRRRPPWRRPDRGHRWPVDTRTTVVAPWRGDGHPDHDAVGHAAAIAADHRGASLWEVSIWAKVRRPLAAAIGARHLVPDGASDRAKRAAAAFSHPGGRPRPGRGRRPRRPSPRAGRPARRARADPGRLTCARPRPTPTSSAAGAPATTRGPTPAGGPRCASTASPSPPSRACTTAAASSRAAASVC